MAAGATRRTTTATSSTCSGPTCNAWPTTWSWRSGWRTPPYASKFNPIEHRLFPHLTRVCKGVILHNIDWVAELMRKATTRTGLTVQVNILDKVYQLGRKVSETAKDAVKLLRDAILPRWNYRILPNV